MHTLKSIYASAVSAVVAIITVTAMTIGAELSAPFKKWLTGLTGHHWVTKSWISFFVFILFFGILYFGQKKNANAAHARKALLALQVASILGFLVILGFFKYEFFIRA